VKFIVNSGILPTQLDPTACNTAVPKKLKDAGIKDVHVRVCYCCNKDMKVVFEIDAPSKDAVAEALAKIDFPVESIMEAEKIDTSYFSESLVETEKSNTPYFDDSL
jgi:hypothetical protein